MTKLRLLGVFSISGLALAGFGGPAKRPLVDPSAVSFPLVEAGTLEIDGTVVGQPRARDGIVYFATREGFLTAVVVPARQILWRFKADHSISASPELGEDHILFRDNENVIYVLDFKGSLVLKKQLGEDVTSAIRENRGRMNFGTSSGKVIALDLSVDGEQLWEFTATAPASAITAGQVFSGDLVILGAADGRLLALDHTGKPVWEFAATGTITADPVEADGRLYFGTENRFFYCLNAATGKKIWARRLQGAPLHPALIHGRRLAVPASNSVVYFLSRQGGSILSWEVVPSRIVHEIVIAGSLILVSSAAPDLVALDFSTGKRVGQHLASGPLVAGALWVSPVIVLVVGDEESGRQRLVFFRSQPAGASAASKGRFHGF
ncbi:MAG: PQQ-binding-like beta-propeller repeat protein [Acidobacteria bacterium]|nr:PQQ-binding-like beta-propeller repeat protein [Acidobacteriota bacterium]